MREPDLQTEHAIETYKSLIQLSTFGLKFVQIVNGGGAIAILAYLGNVTSSGNSAPDLTWSMASFVGGLFFGGTAIVMAYLTQLCLYNEGVGDLDRGGHVRFLYTALALLILSLLAFAVGAACAVVAFAPGSTS